MHSPFQNTPKPIPRAPGLVVQKLSNDVASLQEVKISKLISHKIR